MPTTESSVCLTSEKAPAPSSVFRPISVFQRLLEEFQRGQVAGAQAQAFQIEDLHERHQPKKRDDGQAGRDDHQDHDRTRSIRPLGSPSFCAPAFFGARHGAGIGLVIVAHQVQYAVQHEDLDFLLDGVAEFARLRAGAAQRDGDVAEEGTAP